MMWLVAKPPFDEEAKQAELLGKLNEIPGVSFTSDRIRGMPSIPLSILVNETAFAQLTTVLQWMIEEVKAV
jgi:hypothetical protein